MTKQSNAAAERSAHVERGPAKAETVLPVVEAAPGQWRLRVLVEAEARSAVLRQALRELSHHATHVVVEAERLARVAEKLATEGLLVSNYDRERAAKALAAARATTARLRAARDAAAATLAAEA